MATEPDNVVLRILREIQKTQADHSRILQEHSRAFEKLRIGQDEVRESIVTALGLSAHANVRNDLMEDRIGKLESAVTEIDDLKDRIGRLERHEV